jgi:hypothetical protein
VVVRLGHNDLGDHEVLDLGLGQVLVGLLELGVLDRALEIYAGHADPGWEADVVLLVLEPEAFEDVRVSQHADEVAVLVDDRGAPDIPLAEELDGLSDRVLFEQEQHVRRHYLPDLHDAPFL